MSLGFNWRAAKYSYAALFLNKAFLYLLNSTATSLVLMPGKLSCPTLAKEAVFGFPVIKDFAFSIASCFVLPSF